MFCEHCGKKILDDDKFCPFCGNSTQITYNDQPTLVIQPPEKKKSKGGVVAIVIAFIIVTLAIAFAVLCLTNTIDVNSIFASKEESTSQQTTASEETSSTKATLSKDELDKALSSQPFFAKNPEVLDKDDYVELSQDSIRATVYNNSSYNIKSYTLAFCAYNSKGEPVYIRQEGDSENDEAYIRTMDYTFSLEDENGKEYLEPKEQFNGVYMPVVNAGEIATVKVCVKSFTTEDGKVHTNSYYEDFKVNYAGKSIS
jgi:RNA polymerase subunit RPABC4/transcription elongation factor Spt4